MTDDLNAAQHQAATAPRVPLMIVAGPGTGKTKTLTARIAHLIARQLVPPDTIVALTFTNKAAADMRQRVAGALGGGARLPAVATFHAFALRLLQELPGYSAKDFVSEAERLAIIRSLKTARQLRGLSARELGLLISKAKNGAADMTAAKPLLDAYNLELAARNMRDFDDVLLELHGALQKETWRAKLQARYGTFLVDEFQDTNALQYAILRQLNRTDDLFVIGDPNQSIYGFRGARGDVFGQFKHDFPAAQTVTLTANYRSSPEVVSLANAVFPDSPPLQAQTAPAGAVQAVHVLNEYSEAACVVERIQAAVGGSDMLTGSRHHASQQARSFGDFAILYRSRHVAKTMQRALEASGMPYQAAGEGSPFEQPAVQGVLQALQHLSEGDGYKQAPLLTALKSRLGELRLPQLVSEIIAALQLQTDKNRLALRQFQNSLLCCADFSLKEYLAHVARIAEQQYYDPAADAVTLMTIHASKGLEFAHVFLLAAEDGILPHQRLGQPTDLAEERRLLYVAVSRAAEQLDILHTQNRAGQPALPSPFLAGLPLAHVTDPNLELHKRSAQKRHQKRAQTSLF